MNLSQQHYLQALGIQHWEKRNTVSEQVKLMVVSETILSDKAETLFTAMLNTIGLKRNDVQFTILATDLLQQISQIQPRLIIIFDEKSCEFFLKSTLELTSLRQKIHSVGEKNSPLIVTFHPEFLLKHPMEKKKAYADVLFIQQQI